METLGQLLDATAARFPEREAVAYAAHGEVSVRLGWAELHAASRLAATRLRAAGAGQGTRVALLCSNRPEWLPVAFGAARLGAILVPLSTLWTRDELAYALVHADVELLVTLPGFLRHDYVASLRGIDAPLLRGVVLLTGSAPGTTRWDDLAAADDAPDAAVTPRDPAVIFFTSGTTAQ